MMPIYLGNEKWNFDSVSPEAEALMKKVNSWLKSNPSKNTTGSEPIFDLFHSLESIRNNLVGKIKVYNDSDPYSAIVSKIDDMLNSVKPYIM
jgi:hypothetical protein